MHASLVVAAFFLAVSVVCVHGVSKLPPYIVACKGNDSNFNECAIKNGKAAIPFLIKGDPKYHIPCLDPLKIDKISLDASDRMKLYAENVTVSGLRDMQIKDLDWKIWDRAVFIHLFCPKMQITAKYVIDGQILVLQLKGDGPMNNTHYDIDILANVTYDMITKKDREYIDVRNITTRLNTGKVHFHFGNLLNDINLSDQMNSFLNENWRILVDDLSGSVNKMVSDVVSSIISPIAKRVPFNEIVIP